jgi:hypothetical protein
MGYYFTMALTDLPLELLDIIIEYSLSLSFLNFATTCKKIYTRCKPFIKRHNELRYRFRDFEYYYDSASRDNSNAVVAASDLILLLAAEPIIARYIRSANLKFDSRFILHARHRSFRLVLEGGGLRKPVPSIEEGGDIVQLFANSTHLRRAGLDWKEFYSKFAEDVQGERYSQHGSAFLLTLLEHTEKLTIPVAWKPDAATDQLINILVGETAQSSFSSAGLRSITSFRGTISESESEKWGLSFARPFLALPGLKCFSAFYSFALGNHPQSLAFSNPTHFADALQEAHLGRCCMDDEGISRFLKHTPRLKTLTYYHDTQHDFLPSAWNICKFVNAVAREAGTHLIEFSVGTVSSWGGSILPGRVSARGFQKLEKFELPLDIVMCNIHAAGVTGSIANSMQRLFNGSWDPFVRDIIPPSVTHLVLKSEPFSPYDRALDALFGNFRAIRRTQWINLQEVKIHCKQQSDSAYKKKCNSIVAECLRGGVIVNLAQYG